MQYAVITETKLSFGPFGTKDEAIKKADELGLGDMNEGGEDEPGWILEVVTPH